MSTHSEASPKSEPIENIVVIGGGLMGSSTAWELSKNGHNVLLIERQDSVYTLGSSFGESRISRSLGPKNDIFSFLQQTSVAGTKHLIDFLSGFDASGNHRMEDIYTTSPVTYFYYKHQQSEVDQLFKDRADHYEFAPNREKAFEMFDMSIPESAMLIREHKEFSGTLNPKVLISKLHMGIGYSGNRISYNTKVTRLQRANGNFETELTNVKTNEIKTILSHKVVLAAGPYNGVLAQVIAPYFKRLIHFKRSFLAFFNIKKSCYQRLSNESKSRLHKYYPVLDFNTEVFYSMIEAYDTHGVPILKVGGHLLRSDIEDLDKVWQKELSAEEIEWSKENASNYLSMLNLPIKYSDLEFLKGYSCVYSLTGSEIPYVTNILKGNNEIDPNAILVGGMSGIGAKGALAYGLIAANLLLDKKNTSAMYKKTAEAMGTLRLLDDINSTL